MDPVDLEIEEEWVLDSEGEGDDHVADPIEGHRLIRNLDPNLYAEGLDLNIAADPIEYQCGYEDGFDLYYDADQIQIGYEDGYDPEYFADQIGDEDLY